RLFVPLRGSQEVLGLDEFICFEHTMLKLLEMLHLGRVSERRRLLSAQKERVCSCQTTRAPKIRLKEKEERSQIKTQLRARNQTIRCDVLLGDMPRGVYDGQR